jgi:hypothetical protein
LTAIAISVGQRTVFLKIFTPEILAIKGRSSSRQFYDIPLFPPPPDGGKNALFWPLFHVRKGGRIPENPVKPFFSVPVETKGL